MSGGSFDYAYYKVTDFAEQLKDKIKFNAVPREDDYGYCPNYSEEVLVRLETIVHEAETLSEKMRAVEWLYSGDICEETFIERSK